MHIQRVQAAAEHPGLHATLEDLDDLCGQYRVSGLPVVDAGNHLLGIITNRDLRFTPVAEWATTRVRDVMTPMPLITAPEGISREAATLLLRQHKRERLPLVDAEGRTLFEAALEAAHLRFRPILMTSLAFTLGVMPLFIATGASSASQRAIGTGVVGGMITGTVLAVVFVPTFFLLVRTFFKGSERQRKMYAEHAHAAGVEQSPTNEGKAHD